MIFRLEYKNKALKTARVDIVTPTGTGVETVEGTGYPFMLKYEGDKKNKGLMFLSSSAEINIYETPLFNIDTLKTSGEKDIRVNYYIDSVLEWTGFVIPDFFSREIGGDGVVSMVASDRLAVLDSEVLEGLPVTVTLRTLLSLSLAKTGLTLPLKTVVDFATVSGNTDHLLNHSIRSQRLTDTKGRSVNCKDIIKSILAATNSKIMQRKGEWWVVNKMQHELGGGRVYTSPTAFTNYVEDLISFTDVTRGAMRTIAPVAGGVGVFQEYGGGKLIPDNYNFKNGLTGWTNYNGFTASTNNRRVLGYTQSGDVYTPIYDDAGTSEPYLVNRNISPLWVLFPPPSLGIIPVQWDPYAIRSTRIISPVISGDSNAAKVAVDVNAVGRNGTHLPFAIVLKRPGRENLFLNRSNEWQPRAIAQLLSFKNDNGSNLTAVSAGMSVSAVISAASSGEVLDDVGSYTIEVLIFGSGIQGDSGTVDNTTLINSASVQFSAASNDAPKGTLYKADQGGESYTKIHDTETTVFGDYLTGGLNGYFYNYAPDDTSSLLAPNGSRSQPAWVNTFTQNTEPLPLLQQTIRQMRRMFSVAHDFIKGEIDVADFDPLSIFEDCERRFVIVEAEFDFLRGSLQVVLEEVAYQNLTVREFIYSYFGEGDEGIRGISGISAGSSGGGGGGIAPEPSWLENEIIIDPESGLLSVDGWHVKGNLIIEGQVNQWLAQQLVVDDARIQVNRRQGGVTVDSGLVIHDRDTGLEVSRLVYDVDGIWRAGGQRIYTDAYKPLADNATNLGGYSAASYPRKAENAVITGAWTINNNLRLGGGTTRNLYTGSMRIRDNGAGAWIISPESGAPARWYFRPDGDTAFTNTFFISQEGVGFGTENPQERLHVAENGLFEGNLTTQGNLSAVNATLSGTLDVSGAGTFGGNLSAVNAALSGTLGVTGASTFGGNVGTSNFASQLQGWRVTPAGVADFRHIYTDELQAKAFTADISQALVGSDVLTKSVAKLAQNWATTANGATSTIYVEELEGFPGFQVFAVGDRLLLRLFDRSGGGLLIKNIWATVASYVSTTDNVQRYTITVNSGGATGHTVYAGSMILDYGTSGSGVIERTVLDAMGSPYSQVKTWVNDPSNPANYTIHNRTGNLDGIANASGFGFYGENTFLTGKLLVGDLTKAGQYMEYENGQLNIKGQITVTGGNAATKEDVDAVQVGGRNLWKGSRTSPEQVTVSQYGYLDSGRLLSDVAIRGGQTVTFGFSVVDIPAGEAVMARVDFYRPDGTYSSYTFGNEVIGEGRTSITFVVPNLSEFERIRFRVSPVNFTASYNVKIYNEKLETGNRATDWTPAPEDVDAGIAAAEASTSALATRVENTLGLAQLEGISETLITGGKVRTALLEVTDIVAQGITAGHVEGLTLNFDKGTIGAWEIVAGAISSSEGNIRLQEDAGVFVSSDSLTSNPYASNNRVSMYYASPSDWGLSGRKGGEFVFRLGSTNQIAGINFDDSRIYTQNWELNKDGSFYFGAGGTIDGGLIAGSIESANWDGAVGSRLNLLDGSLEFGNTIKVDSFAKEIIVKDGATQNTGVRIGDFLLSPTSGGAGALDVDLSGSSLVYSVGDFTLPNSLTYINGSGVIRSVSENVSTSLTAGNNYVFQTSINARINRYNVVYTETDPVGAPITTKNSITTKIARITVSLFSGGTKVGEQNFGIFPVPDIVGNTFYNLSLNISIPFVAASSSLRVEIAQSGEVIWKVRHPANEGGLVEYRKVTLVYEEINAASRVRIIPSAAINELSAKGFLSLWGPEKYFRIYDRAGVTNFIEARGVQQFISPNGTYRLRVSDSGIQKSTDSGQSWTTL